MMSIIQKLIITRAVQIRVNRGETAEEAVASYTKLTDDEKSEIISAVTKSTTE